MSVCSSCAHPFPDGAQFCNKCGAKLELPVQKRKCPNAACGNELDDGVLFCAKCGTKVVEQTDTQPHIASANDLTDRKGTAGNPERKPLGSTAWIGIAGGALVVIIGIVIVTILVVNNCGSENVGYTGNVGGQTTIRSISVENMFNDYFQDSQQAQRIYGGKRFRFVGTTTHHNPKVAKKAKDIIGALSIEAVMNIISPDFKVPVDTIPITLHTGGNIGYVVAEFKVADVTNKIKKNAHWFNPRQAITFDANVVGVVSDDYILLTNCVLLD